MEKNQLVIRSLNKALKGWKQMCVLRGITTLDDMGSKGLIWRRQLAEDFAIDALKKASCNKPQSTVW